MTGPQTEIETGLMTAMTVVRPQTLEVQSVPRPAAGPGQVRVRLEGCGVCASDLPPWEGREWVQYPLAPGRPGHEGWGTIDQVGDGVEHLAVGQRVTVLSDNAYAQFDVTDAETVVPLPAALDGRPLPGAPLGGAMNVFDRCGIEPRRTVAVVGVGFLGALLTQLAARAGARVIAISRRSFSRQVASRMGAAQTVPVDDHRHVIETVSELTAGPLCDVVIEAVGRQWSLDLAGELTRERGRLIIAGYHQDGPRQVNMQLWNQRGLDVVNAHERQVARCTAGVARAIDAILGGELDPWDLITHDFPLDKLDQALIAMRDRPDGFLKAVARMDPPAEGA
ncbi:MAG: MDR/zinc-dependent alcohol dehydrogenase-like family protein [Planctomycetota bacterium]